jgi:dipeptidase E
MKQIMKQIIALGGGGFSAEPNNLLLDKYILKQTNKSCPKVCFMPTASGDADNYIMRFYTAFSSLDCKMSHLSLFKPHTKDIASFILEQDAIYVGGGNTKSMIALWKDWGIADYLGKALNEGVVLAGISAGAICWFEEGISDYLPNELNTLSCLGFIKGSCCPHYDGEINRRSGYHNLLLNDFAKDGFAIQDFAALHFIDGELSSAVSSRPASKAFRVKREENVINEYLIETNYLG